MTIQELAEGLCLKSCKLYAMQELAIAWNLAITSINVVLKGFENDGLQKKKEKKVIALYLDEICVNSNYKLRSSSFTDGFFRFWLFSTASVAIPAILN